MKNHDRSRCNAAKGFSPLSIKVGNAFRNFVINEGKREPRVSLCPVCRVRRNEDYLDELLQKRAVASCLKKMLLVAVVV